MVGSTGDTHTAGDTTNIINITMATNRYNATCNSSYMHCQYFSTKFDLEEGWQYMYMRTNYSPLYNTQHFTLYKCFM